MSHSVSLEPFLQVLSQRVEGLQTLGNAATNDDWEHRLYEKLTRPLGSMLPLQQQVFPGDTIAIALGDQVPAVASLVESLLQILLKQGIRPGDIVIVSPGPLPELHLSVPHRMLASTIQSQGAASSSAASASLSDAPLEAAPLESTPLESALPDNAVEGIDSVGVVVHQAANTDQLAMVGVSGAGHPIYLNRWIAEADVVIPIVLMESIQASEGDSLGRETNQTFQDSPTTDTPDKVLAPSNASHFLSEGQHSVRSGYLYPELSSAPTQARLQSDPQGLQEQQDAENLVSPFFLIGVVPAPGNQIGEILVGPRHEIQPLANQCIRQFWSTTAKADYSAIVATIEGNRAMQTLANVYLSLQNASRLVDPHSPIVLVSLLGGDGVAGAAADSVHPPQSAAATDAREMYGSDLSDRELDGDHEETQWTESDQQRSADRDARWMEESLDDDDLTDEEREFAESMLLAGMDTQDIDGLENDSAHEDHHHDGEDDTDEDGGDDDDDSWADRSSRDFLQDETAGGHTQAKRERYDPNGERAAEGQVENRTAGRKTARQWKQAIRMLAEDLRVMQPVYLVSRLSPNATEDLGFGYLGEPDELANLLRRRPSVALLRDAYRWQIRSTENANS